MDISFDQLYKPYWVLACIRIIFTILPQTGYIHPDEYFQSVEVFAGDYFDIEVNKPWEFNASFPLRSVTTTYLTVGLTFKILKVLNYFLKLWFGISIITPYFILVFPRFIFCLLSLLVDYCLYKICVNNNEKYKSRLLVLASSYVVIVYGTHTFSNSVELVLFALLLYFVSESMIFSNVVVRQHEYLNNRYDKAKNVVERAKFHKLRLFLASHSLRNCLPIATVTSVGFFNRPTFVAFAVAPIFFWLYRGIGFKSVMSLQFHLRMLVFLIYMIPTIILLIIVDSFYYGYISWGEIGVFAISINNFVVTPLNFLLYNVNSDNLAIHGLHPKYLHALVNVPILFNILGLLGILGVLDMIRRLIQSKYHYLPTIRSIKGLMTASFILPIALLSIFPHQEPRFIIPVVLPLVYLYSPMLLREPDYAVIKSNSNQSNEDFELKPKGKQSLLLFKGWVVLNAICVMFYGFVHQGGIYPVASHLSSELQSNPSTNVHIVTSHIYSIPEFMLFQKELKKYSLTESDEIKRKRVHLYEEGSNRLDLVLQKMSAILKVCNNKCKQLKKCEICKVYFVIPSSKVDNLEFLTFKNNYTLSFNSFKQFYPHLSIEAIPNLTKYCLDWYPIGKCDSFHTVSTTEYFTKIGQYFGLRLYEIFLLN